MRKEKLERRELRYLYSLTTLAVRNPRSAAVSCTELDLLLQRLSKLSVFIFALSSFLMRLATLNLVCTWIDEKYACVLIVAL